MRRLLISVLCLFLGLFLISCASSRSHKQKIPELVLEYGFLECGTKKIEHNKQIETHRVFCLTESDKIKLENWIIFWRHND